MAITVTPSEINTKLSIATDRGTHRDAGLRLATKLASVYGVDFDAAAAEVNGNSYAVNHLASSTFCGFASFIGVRLPFDTVRFSIWPFDAADMPRFVVVKIRSTGVAGTVLASALVPLATMVVNQQNEITVELGTLVDPAGQNVWFEFSTDGKNGVEASTIATSYTGEDKLFYATNQALPASFINNTNVPDKQILVKTFVTGSRHSFTNGLQELIYATGTFTGWQNTLSSYPTALNVVQMPIYAFDATRFPTKARLRIRASTSPGSTVIATATADLYFSAVGYQLAEFYFDSDITLAGTESFELTANGRIGFVKSSVAGPMSERYATDTSIRAGFDGVAAIAGAPAGLQHWFRSILRPRSQGGSFSAAKLQKLIVATATGGSTTPFTPVCDLTLPTIIPAVVGIETNIYWDGIFTSWLRPENYSIRVNCDRGRHDDNRWRITPATGGYLPAVTSDVGDTAMTVEALHNGTLVTSATTTIRVKAATVGNGQTRKVLVIGDSTTAGGEATQQILDNVTANGSSTYAITLLGTQGTGANKHEGYGGKTYAWLRTSESPFYSGGDFNFAAYLSTNSYSMASTDSVVLLMGINDLFGQSTDDGVNTKISAMMADIAVIIASIQSAVSGINIWLGMVIPPSRDQSAFGNNYAGSTQYRNRYNRNIGMWRRNLISLYGASSGSGIRLAPVNCNLDTINNMQVTSQAVNARNSATTNVQTNGVHPAQDGYEQIGDMLYCCLMSLES